MDPIYIVPNWKEGDGQGENSFRFKLANFAWLNSIQTYHLIVSTKIIEMKSAKSLKNFNVKV